MPPPPPGAYGAQVVGLWPLGLTKNARILVIVFIVLGAVGYIGQRAISFGHPFQQTIARLEVQTAYSQVSSDTLTFRSSAQTCASQGGSNELQCLNSAAGTWASGLQSYQQALGNVSFPASVGTQAAAAESAAAQAASAVNTLASSTTVQEFVATDNSTQFQTTLEAADSTYHTLYSALGG